jgi:hypothetical protein
MLYEKFANEGINAMDNLNIYNVEGYNMLSPGIQPLQPKVYLKSVFLKDQMKNVLIIDKHKYIVQEVQT